MVTEEKKSQAVSRQEIRKKKKAAQKEEKLDKKIKQKKFRKRLVPIWLRVILVLLFSGLALIAGLMIGYGLIGGGEPKDALDWSTWQHIIDIVMKEK